MRRQRYITETDRRICPRRPSERNLLLKRLYHYSCLHGLKHHVHPCSHIRCPFVWAQLLQSLAHANATADENEGARATQPVNNIGKRDSIHHHLLEVSFETATVPELKQKLLSTTPSGWWWYRIGLPKHLVFLNLVIQTGRTAGGPRVVVWGRLVRQSLRSKA